MIYSFGENVMTEKDVSMTMDGVSLSAFGTSIPSRENPYKDYI